MNCRLTLAAKVGWLLLATGVFLFSLWIYDGTSATQDAELILAYGMLTLSFPASQVVLLILGAIGYLAETWGGSFSIPMNYLTLVLEWLVFLGAGYMQWFVLLPWLWRKWKMRQIKTKNTGDELNPAPQKTTNEE